MQIFRRLTRARRPTDFADFEAPIRAELFSAERLEQHAQSLAVAQTVARNPADERALVPRVQENGHVLHEAHKLIGNAARQRLAITPAAEWLLDNFHVVEDQLRDIREHLPAGYYRLLPKLADGPLRGYPRVYGLAWAIVAHTDSRFDPDWLIRFVRAYQRVQPLTIGELWAVPISLRIVMVENLRRLAVHIVGAQMARQGADRFVDELLPDMGTRPADLIERAIRSLSSVSLWPAFAVQLVQRLRYRTAGTTALLEWLHREPTTKGASTDEIVQAQHAGEAAANLTVRNLITSMRAIAAFDWRSFFEEVSLVDEALRRHPGFVAMDFRTRDLYRHAIEELARGSACPEIAVAAAVIAKCQPVQTGTCIGFEAAIGTIEGETVGDPRVRDPGFHLIAAGRPALERELGYRSNLRERCLRACRANAAAVYLGAILLLTLSLAALPFLASIEAGMSWAGLLALGLLGLLPASDIAIALTHRVVTRVFGPRSLPRLALPDGIPARLRTFVVMPTLLGAAEEIAEQVERLETHYLSNRDGEVYFALLTDWRDADAETAATDGELLAAAAAGVEALNARHGPADQTGTARFFLLHRARRWNPSERRWMGWERKRGKLHEFNRLLRGATDTSFLPANGTAAALPGGVRYVVTVDADTRLPIGAVKRLVGTAAHTLNRARWDRAAQRVVHGFGVLQPRVTPAFPARTEATIFQRVFSGPAGLDPYASAVSDVYQDLFGEGSYTGKGLYEVDVFEHALAGRVPENTVLSHDLFESIFARCALVSDVEFFDDFPSSAEVAASRQHRWARGDWQLAPWIFGRAGGGISLINRWKMFDNLRRTLSPIACVLLLLASWSMPGAPQGVWAAFVLTAIAFPGLLSMLGGIVPRRRGFSPANHLRALAADFGDVCAHALISVVMLAHQAWLMLDAIARTLTRLCITRRRLLVWVTAAQARTASDLSLSRALWPPRIENVVVTLAAAAGLLRNPGALPYAVPFLLLWWSAPIVDAIHQPASAPGCNRAPVRRAGHDAARHRATHLAVLHHLRHGRGSRAAARQLPGDARTGRRPPQLADQLRAVSAVVRCRPRLRLDRARRTCRSNRGDDRHAASAASISRPFLQLVRNARAAAARAEVRFHRGQRQSRRTSACRGASLRRRHPAAVVHAAFARRPRRCAAACARRLAQRPRRPPHADRQSSSGRGDSCATPGDCWTTRPSAFPDGFSAGMQWRARPHCCSMSRRPLPVSAVMLATARCSFGRPS